MNLPAKLGKLLQPQIIPNKRDGCWNPKVGINDGTFIKCEIRIVLSRTANVIYVTYLVFNRVDD